MIRKGLRKEVSGEKLEAVGGISPGAKPKLPNSASFSSEISGIQEGDCIFASYLIGDFRKIGRCSSFHCL